MRSRILIVLALLASCGSGLACPVCSYERMAYWWPTTAGIRLVMAGLLVANRLDVVRVFVVFVGYEFLWYYAYRYLLWYGHPAVTDSEIVTQLCSLGLMALDLGVIGAALLLLLGRIRFFRWRTERGLPWWQPWLYVPAAILAHMVAPSPR